MKMPQVSRQVLDEYGDALDDPDVDMVDVLWKYVAPEMEAMQRARTAVLLTAASPEDRHGIRGRLHTLMHGKEGTGKSVLRAWCKRELDAYTLGPKTTDAGLKGTTKGGVYAPGVLHHAHGGVIAPDELDEFDYDDRGALLEAMSEGHYDITQDGVDKTVPAEVRVVAATNDISGFRDELLDRFDFTVELEGYDEDETVQVTEKLYGNFHDAFIENERPEGENPLLGYLDWCRAFEPSATQATMATVTEMAESLIREHGEHGDIRGKEALLRVAYTWAKLNREPLSVEHYVRAVEFVHEGEGYGETLRAGFDV